MLRLQGRRRAQALIAALGMLVVACGDDDGPRDPEDAATPIDTASPRDAGPHCHVACTMIMPGEYRADCVDDTTGDLCPEVFSYCDPSTVPEPERGDLFLVPRCLPPPETRVPYCALDAMGNPTRGET